MIERSYLGPAGAQLHVAANADLRSPPTDLVVLLHQTPRSWDEFREVLERLERPAVAVDTPGYGASDPPTEHTIEAYAAPIAAALEPLDVERLDLVGHHTGGVLAVELAARLSRRVRRVVLSSTPLVDAHERARRAARGGHGIDEVERDPDGGHLGALWRGRARHYPPGRDLLDRFLADALRARDPAAGHHAVAAYEMERRLPLDAPVLCVGHAMDPFGMAHLARMAEASGAGGSQVIAGGHIPLEHTADEFTDLVERFLGARAPAGPRDGSVR